MAGHYRGYRASGTRLSDCVLSVMREPCQCIAAAPLIEKERCNSMKKR